jgi:hypothetical protein
VGDARIVGSYEVRGVEVGAGVVVGDTAQVLVLQVRVNEARTRG